MAPSPGTDTPDNLTRRQHRAEVSGDVHRADEGRVQFPTLEPSDGNLQGLGSRSLVAGDREAGTADPQFAGDPAGDQSSQRAHRPVGSEWRSHGVSKLLDPAVKFRAGQAEVQLPVPLRSP